MSEDSSDAAAPVAKRRPHAATPRHRRLSVRFNDEEYAQVAEHARAEGMSMATYTARSALRGEPLARLIRMSDLNVAEQTLGALLRLHGDFDRAVDEGAGPVVEAIAERIVAVIDELDQKLHG
jgi:hypothetical protein